MTDFYDPAAPSGFLPPPDKAAPVVAPCYDAAPSLSTATTDTGMFADMFAEMFD